MDDCARADEPSVFDWSVCSGLKVVCMNCRNCNHPVYYRRWSKSWTHKRPVWEFGDYPREPLLIRLDRCRDCGCEEAEPEVVVCGLV